jgi:hypothetical protein
MSYDVATNGGQQLKHNQSNSLNTRKTLTQFQSKPPPPHSLTHNVVQPQTTQQTAQQQFEIIKDEGSTRKSVDFKQFTRKNEPNLNKLTISQNGGAVQSQRVSPDHTMFGQQNATGSKFHNP